MTEDRHPPFEPLPMHAKGSDTSKAAADSMKSKTKTLRDEVLAVIMAEICTCDRVEEILGGRHQTISARVRELVMMGLIEDSGLRDKTRSGRSARVYRAVNQGAQTPEGRLF